MYTLSSVFTLIQISFYINSSITSTVILGFVAISGTTTYFLEKKYFSYNSNNQTIENDLVAKLAFIESHREAISLMDAAKVESIQVIEDLKKINSTIPNLSLIVLFSNTFINLSTSVASQFLGGYYLYNTTEALNYSSIHVLNMLIMALLNNVKNIAWILTENYSRVELNLEQLIAFDKSYSRFFSTNVMNNKMVQEFEGNKLKLINFSIHKIPLKEYTESPIPLFDNINLELLANKIYHLSAESGAGKTTFLKAITNNWQYTKGVVMFPAGAENNICFIPQNSFIPKGNLIDILLYPFKISESTNTSLPKVLNNSYEEEEQIDTLINIQKIITRATQLLIRAKLLQYTAEEVLHTPNINWGERLSGGEKQKIGIIRAILLNFSFIIMDEATSALDIQNKYLMYEMIKENITKLENYIVIYTDHNITKCFGDGALTIIGNELEYHDY